MHQFVVDIFNGPHIQAAGGLNGHDQRLVTVHFPRNDGLLLIAAGHTAGDGHRSLTTADVKFFDELLGIGPDRIPLDKAHFLKPRVLEPLQD